MVAIIQCRPQVLCLSVFVALLEGVIPVRLNKENVPDEYRLLHDLLEDYEQTARPRFNSDHVVNVSVRFSLQQIYDLDEKRQILTISGWLTAEWRDEYLVWEPVHYGNLSSIVMSPRHIWTPKLAIGNSATKMFQDWKYFWVTVRSNGECRWQPGGNFAFTCSLDINYYPFDEQSCTMELETWHYTTDMVNLTNSYEHFGLETYLQHGEWAILETEVKRRERIFAYFQAEAFPEIYFTIRMRRKYAFYFMYILLPCLMLSFVLLMTFVLPAESGEKVSLGVSILVAFSVFLLIVAEKVPDTSDAVPVMGIFLIYFMMATSLSIMCSTMIVKFHYGGMGKRPPRWLRVLALETVATYLQLHDARQFYRKHQVCCHLEENDDITKCRKQNTDFQTNGDCVPETQANKSDAKTSSTRMILSRTLSLENIHQETAFIPKGNSEHDGACALTDFEYLTTEWRKVSEVLDRLFFWVFFVFLLVPLVTLVWLTYTFNTTLH